MKLKRILAGFMTAAMVVTSVPVSGLGTITAFAAETDVQYKAVSIKMGAADSQELSGESSGNQGWAKYAVDGDTSTYWHSGYGNPDDKNAISNGEKRNYYIALTEAADVAKLGYFPRVFNGDVNGRILKCKVYTTTAAFENMPVLADITNQETAASKNTEAVTAFTAEGVTWDEVAITTFAEENWANDSTEKEIVFPEVKAGVTGIKIEVEESGAAPGNANNKFLSGAEFKVYEQEEVTEDAPTKRTFANVTVPSSTKVTTYGDAGGKEALTDDNSDTIWHTLYASETETDTEKRPTWDSRENNIQHLTGNNEIIFELDTLSDITKICYQFKTYDKNGDIKQIELYTAGEDGVYKETADFAGEWDVKNSYGWDELNLETPIQNVKYVKIVATHVYSQGDEEAAFICARGMEVWGTDSVAEVPDPEAEKAAAVEALKTALTDEIKAAGASDGSAYTEATWNAFKVAYDTAAAYAADDADLTEVTAEQIAAAKDAVAAAFAALEEVPSEDERIFYPNEDGTFTFTDEDMAFINSMSNFDFSAVYRLTDEAQASNTNELALITLQGESGAYFTVWQRVNGSSAGSAYAFDGSVSGLNFTTSTMAIQDTNWHKFSFSAEPNETQGRIDIWMDGHKIQDRDTWPWNSTATHWKEGLFGTEGRYNQVLVGKKATDVTYARATMADFPGEFKYVKFSKKTADQTTDIKNSMAKEEQSVVAPKYEKALTDLVAECEVLSADDYTAETWTPFAAALATAKEATTEWAKINATDALAAAKAALVEGENPDPGPQPAEPQKAGIKMGAAESQELNGESQTLKGWAGYAVDGDNNTFWHSNYNGSADVKPNIAGGERSSYFIALNEAADVTKVTYLPRQAQAANVNGTILKCEVYVTTDALEGMPSLAEVTDVATAGTKNTEALNVFKAEGVTWKKVAITTFDAGNWANDSAEKEIVFPAVEKGVTGIQVKVLNSGVVLNDNRTDTFISGAEFNVYAQPKETEDPEVVKAAQDALAAAITEDVETKAASNNQTAEGTQAYTNASWNRFKAAYDRAKELAEKEDLTGVTSAELNAAKEALETAAAGLREYVPGQTEEIPVNPDVTVAAPTAGQAVPSGLATLTSSSISSNVATLVPGDNFETGEDGAVRGRITDANPNDPDSIFNVTGTTKLLFRMKIKSDAPAENGIQSLIGKMNDQYGVQMEKSGDTTRIYFYAKLVPAKWAEASYTIPADYDWSQWHDLVTYYDGSALHLWVDGNAETSNRNLTGELQNCADAVFTLGYNYAPKQDNQTLAAGWDYSGWMKDIGLYIGEHVPELNITSEMDAAAVTAAFDTALADATSDFVLSGAAAEQEDYMEVTATTWTPATGTVSPYEDYAVSVELTAKEGYYFGENAAATLRTSAANVLTGATVTVSDDGSAMTINYTFEGEEHPQVTLQNYLASEEFTAIGNENVGENGKRKYTKDSWNAYAEKAAAAVEKAYNNNLEPAAYTTARTELAAAIAALELAAEHCECTLGDITKFDGTTLDLQGSTEITVTLGTGEYTYSNDCVKHENATPAVSYALVGNPAGATLTGNVLKVTQPGTVQVRFTVTLGDQTKSATATYTVVKTATAEQKDALTKAIKEVEDKYVANADKYTADSWKKLDDALKAAKALGDNASADQVVAATKAVNDAIAGLVLAGPTDLDVAKEAVNKALTAADAIYAAGQKDYTDATWKAFADAYQAAKAAPANADAAALNALAAALTKAQAALAKNAVQPPKKGEVITMPDGSRYEVVDPNAKTAKLVKVKSKKATKLNVPATVKLQGETYKVTGVGKNVMSKNKKLTKVILGKNVTTIETKAFYGCTKLKTVQLKGKALKKVGKQAFKKTYAKMVVSAKKMNKKEKAKLLKTMRKAGMSKKGKVK